MIRKGIRPAYRPALGLPRAAGDCHLVMPFRRSWILIAVLAAFDAAFLIPAVFTFRQAAAEWGRFEDLFDLVGAVFLSAWLLGWSIGPLLLTTLLALLMFGRETIRVRDERLDIFFGLPFLGLTASYRLSAVRNLRLTTPPPRSRNSWRGPHLEFDYGANTIAVGSNAGERELAELATAIRSETGRPRRSGEATEEELRGDWKPNPVVASLTGEQSAPAAARDVQEKVTLASPSAITLILANLVPLYGSVFLGWRLSDVMVLYWAESAVIGFSNVCKIAVISRWMAIPAGVFFLSHFGAFMAVHFLFIYSVFIEGPANASGGDLGDVARLFADLWPALAALFASHAFSFYRNFLGRSEYRGRTLKDQMTEPYSRVIFMHLVLIFGGGLTLVLGEPTPVLFIVIVLKIWMDLRAHLREHHQV